MSDCLFCKICEEKSPRPSPIATTTCWPSRTSVQAPFHQLVIPIRHLANLIEAKPDDAACLENCW